MDRLFPDTVFVFLAVFSGPVDALPGVLLFTADWPFLVSFLEPLRLTTGFLTFHITAPGHALTGLLCRVLTESVLFGQVGQGVYRFSIPADFKIQPGAIGTATAHFCNHATRLDEFIFLNQQLAVVPVGT